MNQETTEPYGWQKWTTSNGYVIVAQTDASNRRDARVELTGPDFSYPLISFEHNNPLGAARELAIIIEQLAHKPEHAVIWPLPGDGEETQVRLFNTDEQAVEWGAANAPTGGWQYASVVPS